MPKDFFARLHEYYSDVAKVLRNEASAASIFRNTTDIGNSREDVYRKFLKEHCPSKCNVLSGGFLFDEDGNESRQIDVIITTDTCPQFNLFSGGKSKTFACVEGALGCVSVKSTLDKDQLVDSLENLASIPATRPLGKRASPLIRIDDYADWPYKVIYASDGSDWSTIDKHVQTFYAHNPDIPVDRRPNLIHVAGKFLCFRAGDGATIDGKPMGKGTFGFVFGSPDVQAITLAIHNIQNRAAHSSHILYDYEFLINRAIESLRSKLAAR